MDNLKMEGKKARENLNVAWEAIAAVKINFDVGTALYNRLDRIQFDIENLVPFVLEAI